MIRIILAFTIFIPLLISSPFTNVGVTNEGSYRLLDTYYNPNTNLKIPIRWYEVEYDRGYYDWRIPDNRLGEHHPMWIQVSMSTLWASGGGNSDPIVCKIPDKEYWPEYQAFVQAVIDRYHPEYIEVWNEPDANYEDVPIEARDLMGCEGTSKEAGELYGEFAEKIAINTHGTKIVAGALLDVNNRDFVDEMVDELHGRTGLSFHCYEPFMGKMYNVCVPLYKEVKSRYGLTIYLSETAVKFWHVDYMGDAEQIEAYHDAQITYAERLKKKIDTPWSWYAILNGWPPVDVDCIRMSTDLITKNVCTGEIVTTPVWDWYMKQ